MRLRCTYHKSPKRFRLGLLFFPMCHKWWLLCICSSTPASTWTDMKLHFPIMLIMGIPVKKGTRAEEAWLEALQTDSYSLHALHWWEIPSSLARWPSKLWGDIEILKTWCRSLPKVRWFCFFVFLSHVAWSAFDVLEPKGIATFCRNVLVVILVSCLS